METLMVMAAKDERQLSSSDVEFYAFARFFTWLGFVARERGGGSSHVDLIHKNSCKLDTKEPTGVKFALAKSAKGGGAIHPMRQAQESLDHFEKAFRTWEIHGLSGKQVVSKLMMLLQRGGWEGTGEPPPNWWSWKWHESPWWKEYMLKEKPVEEAPVQRPVTRVKRLETEGDAALLELEGVSGWFWCPMAELPRGMRMDEPLEFALASDQAEPPELSELGLGLRRVELRRPAKEVLGSASSAGWAADRRGRSWLERAVLSGELG